MSRREALSDARSAALLRGAGIPRGMFRPHALGTAGAFAAPVQMVQEYLFWYSRQGTRSSGVF